MLTSAQATYEELEEIAVTDGDHTMDKGDREIPRGRWCFHPDGYFMCLSPRGYTKMLIELYVPEIIRIKKDDLGRIVSIEDDQGNKITSEYDDTINPLEIPGEPDLMGYALRIISFERMDLKNPGEKLQMEWTNSGWTFIGIPSGKGQPDSCPDRFTEFTERYQGCIKHRQELDNLVLNLGNRGAGDRYQGLNSAGLKHIMNLGHYAMALEAVISNGDDPEDWMVLHKNLVKRAWQSKICSNERTFKNAQGFQRNHHNIETGNGYPLNGNNRYAEQELLGFKEYQNQSGPSLNCQGFSSLCLSGWLAGLGNQTSFNPSQGAGISGDEDEQAEGLSGQATKTQDRCVKENNERLNQIENNFYKCVKKFSDPYNWASIELCKQAKAIALRISWQTFDDCLINASD
jgi:hypothetical protein